MEQGVSARAGAAFGSQAVVLGLGWMFKELLGTLAAEQSGHSSGMHVGIFRAYIATCADLLELVN